MVSLNAHESAKSDGKCQQRSNLQKWKSWLACALHIYDEYRSWECLLRLSSFADLTPVDICHPTKALFSIIEIHPSMHMIFMNAFINLQGDDEQISCLDVDRERDLFWRQNCVSFVCEPDERRRELFYFQRTSSSSLPKYISEYQNENSLIITTQKCTEKKRIYKSLDNVNKTMVQIGNLHLK